MTCPQCSAEMTGPVCAVCEAMERVRVAASLRRFRAVAHRRPWRPRVPKAANGRPVAAQAESSLPPSDRRE